MRWNLKPTIEVALALLMERQLPRNVVLHPEQRLSIDLAEEMRRLTATGSYRGIWFCVQNEAKRHRITAMIQKAMGLISGVSDFVFIWDGGAACVELKAGKNKQSEYQTYFQIWCEHRGVPYFVCRGVEEVKAILLRLGAINPA